MFACLHISCALSLHTSMRNCVSICLSVVSILREDEIECWHADLDMSGHELALLLALGGEVETPVCADDLAVSWGTTFSH